MTSFCRLAWANTLLNPVFSRSERKYKKHQTREKVDFKVKLSSRETVSDFSSLTIQYIANMKLFPVYYSLRLIKLYYTDKIRIKPYHQSSNHTVLLNWQYIPNMALNSFKNQFSSSLFLLPSLFIFTVALVVAILAVFLAH
jgi:hypothetical protein